MIKFPFIIYDLRSWTESEIENFIVATSDLFDAEKIMNQTFRFSIIVNPEQYELVKDINASIIVETTDKDFYQNLLIPFNKTINNEELLDDLKNNEIYWELKREDYLDFKNNVNKMIDFIKNADKLNFIVTLDDEIDYKKLRVFSLTDFINVYQDIQLINPNLNRQNIRILFKLNDSVETMDQIKMISELTNISGVIFSNKLTKEIINNNEGE